MLGVEHRENAVKEHFVFVTDRITCPHFTTHSKKTIMVLFPRVTQDHWDLNTVVRTKTGGRAKLELQVPLSCIPPATDTGNTAQLYFYVSSTSSHRFLLLGFYIQGLPPMFTHQALFGWKGPYVKYKSNIRKKAWTWVQAMLETATVGLRYGSVCPSRLFNCTVPLTQYTFALLRSSRFPAVSAVVECERKDLTREHFHHHYTDIYLSIIL